ncbi:49a8c059-71d9-4e07-bbbb-e6b6fd2ee3bf [Thermothielavioides terrestris]|uniref:49a8c059-71d9-4e07-bbbb-e6b6fd2ee3bf n=1 Tax=Thermothielavioides terrestris TaxID=2587410 RepID=A0A446BW43_9PEZI|nr:49a8c059-71d9-4e07-bbbb-e6b6fd2ee3bf [Thermothielavioides terrestris]
MKAAFFSLFAFAASALASPIIAQRQATVQVDALDNLIQLVKGHTANINKTISAVQENPTVEEQTSTAAALLPELQAITEAVQSVTGGLVQRQVAVSVDAPEVVDGVQEKVQELTLEIASTLNAVIAKVGLSSVIAGVTPLLSALLGLAGSIEKVVGGVLAVVKGLLATVLGGVAGPLLGLLF